MTDCIKHFTDSIHYELEQTSRLMKILGLQLFKKLEIGISMDEYATLDTVSINAGICQRDLAKMILKDRANTGRILDNLERQGLITRFIDTKNNRLVKKMGITEKGLNELNSINNKIRTYFESVTKKVNAEDVERVQKTLKAFRLELEKVVETNI
ncbi:MarR family transcriptional regulator [bacterium]|uniref:MarR family transcriptional regulator n=1 Tax=Candidatus Scatenecus faecavium TaxID=2840915 RepID=A0A9D1FUN7_9BACT|nr:MarR family transcriptional regulator [bacterium]HIS82275.1 MarR family transcriptional regulator [Candidatus Scatenecus faecavium]